jgi:hypothetical protein
LINTKLSIANLLNQIIEINRQVEALPEGAEQIAALANQAAAQTFEYIRQGGNPVQLANAVTLDTNRRNRILADLRIASQMLRINL